jgi:hypothetical protein
MDLLSLDASDLRLVLDFPDLVDLLPPDALDLLSDPSSFGVVVFLMNFIALPAFGLLLLRGEGSFSEEEDFRDSLRFEEGSFLSAKGGDSRFCRVLMEDRRDCLGWELGRLLTLRGDSSCCPTRLSK